MKHALTITNRPRRRTRAGFTLVEMMMGVGLFLVIFVAAMVGLQLFGARVYTLSATKLAATADARKTLNSLRKDIRSAKLVYVGTFNNGAFARIPNGEPQTGNALEVFYPDDNDQPSPIPVIFYQNPNGTNVCISSNGVVQVLANFVTNYFMFTAEDYQANIMVNYGNNPVIRVTMQFHQWEFPLGVVGPDGLNAYNHYRLQTRISRRLKE